MVDGLLVNAGIIAVLMLGLCAIAARIRDVSFIDAVWGAGMAVLAIQNGRIVEIDPAPKSFR